MCGCVLKRDMRYTLKKRTVNKQSVTRESRKRKTNPSERIQRDRSIIIGDLLPTYLMNSKVSYVSNSKN